MLDELIKEHADGMTITVRVIPNASRNAAALDEERKRLVIRITAPPAEGKANSALVLYLAKLIAVSRSSIKIIKGASAREKVLLIRGITPEEFRWKFENALVQKT